MANLSSHKAAIGKISQTFTPTEGITSFVSAGCDPN